MKSSRVPFTVLLPLLTLLSWVCCVAVPVTFNDLLITEKFHQYQRQRAQSGRPAQSIPHARILLFAAGIESNRVALWINGIDQPANFVELPIDRFLPAWPDTWHPKFFTVFSWRAITFPFYSLPFWWFAGLGLDAFFMRRNSRWPVLLVGTISFALAVLLLIILSVTPGAEPDPAVTRPILVGGILWVLLFAAFPAAWIRKGLARRALQHPPRVQ